MMDLGLLYRALQNNQVDLVAGSNTDGLIAALDLTVLEDDRRYFPPYDAVPLVRQETLRRRAREELPGPAVVCDGQVLARLYSKFGITAVQEPL